jgi:AcrR family transcriptional regulator
VRRADDIAERAGVSKPVLYQHFPGKLELYVALLDRHVDALVRQVRTALSSTTDNRERVHRCITAYYDFVAHEDGAYRLVFESDLRNEPAVSERIERALSQCVDAIADTIAADMGIPSAEARLLSVAIAGQAEMSARWWLTASESVSRERAVELLAGLVWRGLRGKPKE